MGEHSQKRVRARVELDEHDSDCEGYKEGFTNLRCNFEVQTKPGNELLVHQAVVNEIQKLLDEKFNK